MQYLTVSGVFMIESDIRRAVIVSSEESQSRLAEIFSRERSRFLRFVRRQADQLSSTDAEDVLSDVTYSLLSRADVVEQVENLTAYIYRSLANRIVDQYRRSVPVVAIAADDASDDTSFELKDERPRPDQRIEQSELRRRMHEAVGKLTPRERAVWIATEIEGSSFRDLAEEWDVPIGTLLSLKSRATARLRSLLSEYRNSHSS